MSVTIDREMEIKKPSKFLRLRRFLFWIIFKSNRLHWRGRLQPLVGLALQTLSLCFNRLHWRGRLQLGAEWSADQDARFQSPALAR